MHEREKILLLDVPSMARTLAQFIDIWGYEPIGISSADSIEQTIIDHDIDLIVLANEMTRAGPSLDGWKQGEKINIDFEFGLKIVRRLRQQNINLPIIVFTTDDLEKTQWLRNDDGRLGLVIIEKRMTESNLEDLKEAMKEFVGGGLVREGRA